jgi:hypothetical protein
MAANTPTRPNPDDRDPLGPVEPIDAFDDGLIVSEDGVRGPAGIPTPTDPAEVKHANRELEELEELAERADRPTGGGMDSDDAIGGHTSPAQPASGWLPSATKLTAPPPEGRSTADIDLPPVRKPGEEPSDIFSTARRSGGSDLFGSGASDAPRPTAPESDLFIALPNASDRGSSVFDEPSRVTDRVEYVDDRSAVQLPDVTGHIPLEEDDERDEEFVQTEHNIELHSDAAGAISGFDHVDKENSGSDLFGDATVVDVNLMSQAGGGSGINLLDPDALPDADASLSSIFSSKAEKQQASDGGRVDLDSIPMTGGTGAERTDAMFRPPEPSPASDVFGAVASPAGDDDAAAIDWDPPPTEDAGEFPYQSSMARRLDDEMTAADLSLHDEGPEKTSADEESVFSMPTPKAIADMGLSEVLTEIASKAETPPPVQTPAPISVKRVPAVTVVPAPTRREVPPEKTRSTLPVLALGLGLGLAVGATGVYVGGGKSEASSAASQTWESDVAAARDQFEKDKRESENKHQAELQTLEDAR